MILRKPFAFLIKHFRKIHFLLTILIGYSFYRLIQISSYFNDFANNANLVTAPDNLISITLIIIVLLIAIFNAVMYYLMKKKDKPRRFYLLLIIYYLLLFILLIYSRNLINNLIDMDVVSLEKRRIYRDIANMFTYPQAIFLIFSLIRAIGFDIKKFDFGKDLKELEITDADNEEFEFVLGIDFNKYFVKIRRNIRELRYYFLENTKIIILVLTAVIVLLSGLIVYKQFFSSKVYSENTSLITNNFRFQIIDSYVTNLNQNGNIIENGKSYIILRVKIKNLSKDSKQFDLSNYKVYLKNKSYNALFSKNNNFTDLGRPYSNESINSNEENEYLLIYEISDYEEKEKYTVKIFSGYTTDKMGRKNVIYKTIKLSLKSLNNIKNDNSITYNSQSENNVLDLKKSFLGDSSLKINGIEITNKYNYTYQRCTDNGCSNLVGIITPDIGTNNVLLVIDYDLSLNSENEYTKNINNKITFSDYFLTIKYYVDGVENGVSKKVKNNNVYTDKLIIEVPSRIEDYDKIELIFTIRDSRNTIIIEK